MFERYLKLPTLRDYVIKCQAISYWVGIWITQLTEKVNGGDLKFIATWSWNLGISS